MTAAARATAERVAREVALGGAPRRRASARTLLALALRESRTARRRLLLYMSSIALGVAALVAIDSFAANVARSVREQSRTLVGGDVALSSGRGPFPKTVAAFLDSVQRAGTPVARMTSFASMGLVPRTGLTRLVQVRAVTPAYPFYGEITTRPAGRWAELQEGPHALVDRGLLIALDARVGDTLTLGYGRFVITGTLETVPGDAGIAAVLGPRVYIPARYLAETQLLVFGSRAEYEALLKLPERVDPDAYLRPLRAPFRKLNVRARTIEDVEQGLTRALDRLTEFLSIVGLIALLLGGVGVASGVSAFVARKIDAVAVLRCLGATSRQVLAIYLTQAGVMGLIGAGAGALLGIAVQFLLPRALGDFLPVNVAVSLAPTAILSGLLVGVWVALVFALRPLLALRRVSPLQAIRRDVDPTALHVPGIDWPRRLVELAVVASVVGLAIARTGRAREGLAIAGGIAVALLALWGSATAVAALARRLMSARWPYVVRQGVANLYRPANQTRAVTLALGFGAFLVSTIYLVQSSILRELDLGDRAGRANVVFFDVQDDQAPALDSIIRAGGDEVVQRTPIVTMRIAAINGRPTARLIADAAAARGRRAPGDRPPDDTADGRGGGARGGRADGRQASGRSEWPLRREYRSTYRAGMVESERLVEGRWFADTGRTGAIAEVSLDRDIARELGVALGDTVTWDVQGVPVATRVTSLREVNWARFQPNFYAVLQPAAISSAPKQWVFLAHAPTPDHVARLQRDIVQRQPNVSSVDLSLIQQTVGAIVDKVSVAVRFLAVFCLAMGVPVLFSAVAATRRDRLREGVLLKVLGATRAQIRRILLAEYAVLGAIGALAGMVLSFGGAWALTRWAFDGRFSPAYGAAASIALVMMAMTVGIGLLTGREVFRETPMAAIREV